MPLPAMRWAGVGQRTFTRGRRAYMRVEQLTQLIAKYSQQPLVKYIGQPVVNIVELNLALDKLDE